LAISAVSHFEAHTFKALIIVISSTTLKVQNTGQMALIACYYYFLFFLVVYKYKLHLYGLYLGIVAKRLNIRGSRLTVKLEF
jgi:hypothetical protein